MESLNIMQYMVSVRDYNFSNFNGKTKQESCEFYSMQILKEDLTFVHAVLQLYMFLNDMHLLTQQLYTFQAHDKLTGN